MQKILKNTMLKYLPKNFEIEQEVNVHRIFDFNQNDPKGKYLIYLCERELRVKDNFALQFALKKSIELNLSLKIIHPKIFYVNENKQIFIDKQIKNAQKIFFKNGLDFEIFSEKNKNILDYFSHLNTAILVIDFNPILNRNWLKNSPFKVYEIDGHNIIPTRFISNKQEYNAATFRRKFYQNIYPFMTEFQNITTEKSEADFVLENFIKNKLSSYSNLKNNPVKNVLSGLSKYLNLGFISSQRVVLEILKSDISDIDKETFFEEIIIRKELADNFCFYCQNFKTLKCIPLWAKNSLAEHKFDKRDYIYSLGQLENAQTHDNLWNAAQVQLIKEGSIHGYLRMYWAKKILEWTFSPETALEIAITLNDKYAYDAPSANGYVGILWAIGGLHDRAFRDYKVSGKIRRMTFNSLKRKFDISEYINKHLL